MTFAQTIRAKRQALGLTQAEFASRLAVSQQTVNNWECGRVEPWDRRKQVLLDCCAGLDGTTGAAVSVARSATVSTTASDAKSVATRRRKPNVCEEIASESAPDLSRQESMARPQIDFRRPPPHG